MYSYIYLPVLCSLSLFLAYVGHGSLNSATLVNLNIYVAVSYSIDFLIDIFLFCLIQVSSYEFSGWVRNGHFGRFCTLLLESLLYLTSHIHERFSCPDNSFNVENVCCVLLFKCFSYFSFLYFYASKLRCLAFMT